MTYINIMNLRIRYKANSILVDKKQVMRRYIGTEVATFVTFYKNHGMSHVCHNL